MYDLIDQLVSMIINDEIYQTYLSSNKKLNDKQVKKLLKKHQDIQNQYFELKKYESYVSIDETKDSLKAIKKEMMNNEIIQKYYQDYYALNELLDELCQIIFKDISDEIVLKRY